MGYLDRLKAIEAAPQVNTTCVQSVKSPPPGPPANAPLAPGEGRTHCVKSVKSPLWETAPGDNIPMRPPVEGPGAPVEVRLHCAWCGSAIADGVVCSQTRCRAALEHYPWLQPLQVREAPRG